MTDPKEHLLDWLRDAHAIEQQAEQMLRDLRCCGRRPFSFSTTAAWWMRCTAS
ncbi:MULTISPECIES: DUF892 family protein [unclassified Caballeronia]|uniref:DUF892 family protein n=1 Tax=unclassified Caballeronia TaxID=2646786 RepID=UPI00285E6919|nr:MULTISPECIES: DUF892 family protein [unclassified Caballeronia]MDR5752582.1 DUF892 family protein [Caballeronia sp. LZ024]MDR5841738.1 DUF892 family protein [Caballeronia sp. LZ031]